MNLRWLLVFLVLTACTCHAAEVSVDSSAVPGPSHLAAQTPDIPSTYGLVARTAFSLLVVVLLIWGAVHLMRRFSGGASSPGLSHVRVLERAYVAPKKAIYVVQIGSRSLAVGVTDTQITALLELDHEETTSAYPASLGRGGSPPFAGLLKDVRARFTSSDAPGEKP